MGGRQGFNRQYVLATRARNKFLHVIARSIVACADTRQISACHCEERSDVAIRSPCSGAEREAILWANTKVAADLPWQHVLAHADTRQVSACHCVLAPAHTCPPSACHCEPVRTLVWQSASPQRSLASWHYFGQIRSTFPYSPKVLLSVMPCRREYGLPRRYAHWRAMPGKGRNHLSRPSAQ